mmetsp:Transcript_10921/g.18499  ORF Transcript_10921/g.18499 Transcript_10921/m.18499 type:complete len:364 (-) Transcript_10921:402-1493(-)
MVATMHGFVFVRMCALFKDIQHTKVVLIKVGHHDLDLIEVGTFRKGNHRVGPLHSFLRRAFPRMTGLIYGRRGRHTGGGMYSLGITKVRIGHVITALTESACNNGVEVGVREAVFRCIFRYARYTGWICHATANLNDALILDTLKHLLVVLVVLIIDWILVGAAGARARAAGACDGKITVHRGSSTRHSRGSFSKWSHLPGHFVPPNTTTDTNFVTGWCGLEADVFSAFESILQTTAEYRAIGRSTLVSNGQLGRVPAISERVEHVELVDNLIVLADRYVFCIAVVGAPGGELRVTVFRAGVATCVSIGPTSLVCFGWGIACVFATISAVVIADGGIVAPWKGIVANPIPQIGGTKSFPMATG